MFSSLSLKKIYRTNKDDVDDEFFIPVIKSSVKYFRGTGFFNIESLLSLSDGLITYVKNGGSLKIITSVSMDFDDVKNICLGYASKNEKLENEILKEIENQLEEERELLKMDLITNLIAVDRIEIKVAYLPNGGIYHEKIGYFEDSNNNSIWFIGSNNETYSGKKKNIESFTVLKSWEGDDQEIKNEKNYFMSLWNNEEEGIEVVSFPDAAKKKLFKLYKKSDNCSESIAEIEKYYKRLNVSNEKRLYKYQEEAIEQFITNKGCHFYAMATGTGKTFTAVKTIEKLNNMFKDKNLYVVVIVPQVDLQIQWQKELKEAGIVTYCFGGIASNKNLDDSFTDSIIECYNGKKIAVISTYDTFFSKLINNITAKKNLHRFIIVDEAHELSPNQIKKLPEGFKLRLGLSATPQRHNPNETEKIIEYFTKGSVEPFKYTIEQAIENGFLSRYEYYPLEVHLTEEEFNSYQSYTKKLAVLLNEEIRDLEKIKDVCNNRSLIVKKATNKISKLEDMILSKNYNFVNSVIYCGQGKDFDTEETIIDKVSKLMANIGKYRVSQFTSKTVDRKSVLEEFENGYYDSLIAIKCFDQGVDVPKLDKIYIMSSDTLERQTIQRRGRVLRKCKETGKKLAYIYDMVVLPPDGYEFELGASSLVVKELKRMTEYGRVAENKNSIEQICLELKYKYGVKEDSDDEEKINDQ